MVQKDNLDEVKKFAIVLLNLDVHPGDSETFVNHPIFKNRGEILLPDGATDFTNAQIVDILGDSEGLEKARAYKKKLIEGCDSVGSVIKLIQKPYRLAFLNRIKQYISMKTFSEWLGEIWVTVENPNMDAMISIDTLLEWFTEADKTVLMSSDELKTYNNLPDEVQIYRGVGEKSNPKGLSWTLNIEKAKWFADRYKKGYVLTALAKKKDILAYFAGRKEEEVIIDGSKLNAKKLSD